MAMGMPTGPLSSNWELLRKRLDAAAPPKRKPAAADKEEPAKKKVKRRRADSAADTVAAKRPKPHRDSSSSSSAPRKHIVSMSAAADEQKPATTVSASLALWAEGNDIPAEDVARAYGLPLNTTKVAAALIHGVTLEPEAGSSSNAASRTESGRYVAMDCEMVGVGDGERESSALARVSIVNFHGHCVLDCFVRPKERVTDWRTWVSGVSPKDMVNAITFEEAQKKVADILDGRILVGHAIKNDLDCLLIGHPKRDIRDTSRHAEFRKYSKGRTPALKKLAKEILGIEIQGGAHSSIEDARACMRLYRQFKDDFERENQIHFPNKPKKSGRGGKKKKNKK